MRGEHKSFDRKRDNEREEAIAALRKLSLPLEYNDDLTPLLERLSSASHVLLGEASHGTAEFYLWRAAITRRIIERNNVSFIAVEGDWPECYQINRYIKSYENSGSSAENMLSHLTRWPTWMWGNEEMIDLIEWLKEYNKMLDDGQKIGFYGMDVYSLWDSMREVLHYLEKVDPQAADQAKEAYACFDPYHEDADRYALASSWVPESCEEEVISVLKSLREKMLTYPHDREARFNADQNAFVVSQAELYYRTMVSGGAASWNIRDMHMVYTINRLREYYGGNGQCIIWAHNTHIGDARYTDMLKENMVNIGQLLREQEGEANVFSVGFSSYRGSVIASDAWGGEIKVMGAPAAKENSWDELLHRVSPQNKLLLLTDHKVKDGVLSQERMQRAIGVVYNSLFESGNYVPTQLALRYDALLFINIMHALHPLHFASKPASEFPETYPSAL